MMTNTGSNNVVLTNLNSGEINYIPWVHIPEETSSSGSKEKLTNNTIEEYWARIFSTRQTIKLTPVFHSSDNSAVFEYEVEIGKDIYTLWFQLSKVTHGEAVTCVAVMVNIR